MTVLPGAARRFSRRYANIELVLDDCAPNQFLPLISSERVELGIGVPPPATSEFDSRPILEDNMVIVCASDHEFAALDEVRWADLKDVPVIAFRYGYGVRQLLDTTAAKAGFEPRIVHEVGFLFTAAWMAASGLGVTILPAALARLQVDAALITRPLVEPEVTRTLALVTKKGRSLSPPCRLFVNTLLEEIGTAGQPR